MKEIIVALDSHEFSFSKRIVDELSTEKAWFKVGLEAFYSHGSEILSYLEKKDLKVFLDLKLHDIPTTVVKSLAVLLKRYPLAMTNIHALGGFDMLRESSTLVEDLKSQTKLLGVTILTSHEETTFKQNFKSNLELKEMVHYLNSICVDAKLNGVVCSAKEALMVKERSPEDFLIVTPGVRLNTQGHDQKRVTSPKEAFDMGATHIVVGREITKSNDPLRSFLNIKESIYE